MQSVNEQLDTTRENKHRCCRTVPLCSQGNVVFQPGEDNGVVSADLLLFCSFSSSASSLPKRTREKTDCSFKTSTKPNL